MGPTQRAHEPSRAWRFTATCTRGSALRRSRAGGRARLRPEAGVTVSVLADGTLELVSEHTAQRLRCGPEAAAVWIALCQHDGRSDAAANMLAELWDIDPLVLRLDIDQWADELRDAGLIRHD